MASSGAGSGGGGGGGGVAGGGGGGGGALHLISGVGGGVGGGGHFQYHNPYHTVRDVRDLHRRENFQVSYSGMLISDLRSLSL